MAKSKKRKPGRPPRENPRKVRLNIALTRQEAKTLMDAAKDAGLSRSEWMRSTLLKAAK